MRQCAQYLPSFGAESRHHHRSGAVPLRELLRFDIMREGHLMGKKLRRAVAGLLEIEHSLLVTAADEPSWLKHGAGGNVRTRLARAYDDQEVQPILAKLG